MLPLLDSFGFLGREPLWPLYFLLAAMAMAKYLVPFLPGDTLMLVSLFFIGVKEGSWIGAMVAIALGGAAGAIAAFYWGYSAKWLRGPKSVRRVITSVQPILKRWGWWPLLFNRFIPYVRPFLFPAAGLLKMPRKPVFASALAGNFLFGVVLAGIGYGAGRHYARLTTLYHLYQYWLGALFLLLVLFLGSYLFFRKRNKTKDVKEPQH